MCLVFGIICPAPSLPKSFIDFVNEFDVGYPLCVHHSIQSWDNCSYWKAMLRRQWNTIHFVRQYGSIHNAPVKRYSDIVAIRAPKNNVNRLWQDPSFFKYTLQGNALPICRTNEIALNLVANAFQRGIFADRSHSLYFVISKLQRTVLYKTSYVKPPSVCVYRWDDNVCIYPVKFVVRSQFRSYERSKRLFCKNAACRDIRKWHWRFRNRYRH